MEIVNIWVFGLGLNEFKRFDAKRNLNDKTSTIQVPL